MNEFKMTVLLDKIDPETLELGLDVTGVYTDNHVAGARYADTFKFKIGTEEALNAAKEILGTVASPRVLVMGHIEYNALVMEIMLIEEGGEE